ncbi:MAG: FIST C-terminal domain-containing protein [Planctomycetota bacterium]|jgi:hypothetical protein|nr:FIST C-terminal domain-containing protein [Planctomycetota bacterium]
MQVSVGYSENPDVMAAAREVVEDAMGKGDASRPCDVALLFSTSRHDPAPLGEAVAAGIGGAPRIVGGGAIGVMSNDRFGYAGDQVGLAMFWLSGDASCEIVAHDGMKEDERKAGAELGRKLRRLGTEPEAPVMLFYDAIDATGPNVRMLMATPLLAGLRDGLGFLPNLVGAGLMGDYSCTPIKQWNGAGLTEYNAVALKFGGGIRLDSAILRGCRPATGYYTVTRAEGQVILEINGEPALTFLQQLLGPAIPPEEYSFFLIFGINHGEKWGRFNEENYAGRLCLGIDRERNGIVMFEPDMVAGTVFQIMFRSLDPDFVEPKVEALFAGLEGRKPAFAFFIDCAGRAAGYAGVDVEDAVIIQKIVAGRAPLLGIYSGVEIAPVLGEPRPLDWTGVFCLFSEPA